MRLSSTLVAAALLTTPAAAQSFTVEGNAGSTLTATPLASFNEPWAMTFLPSGEMLVTEKSGRLFLVSGDGRDRIEVSGVPDVAYGGQGGFGDVVLHPDFAGNNTLYLSYAEPGNRSRRGAAVAQARLARTGDAASLQDVQVIWRQEPKVTGAGHYGHRIAFAPDGTMFISSGDRQKLNPAQDMGSDLGKMIRLNDDGSVPADNPYQDAGERAKLYWSIGHRNPLGVAFDGDGQLWAHEMGPRGGDELNLVEKAENYGWPEVSNGRHYSGLPIPNHDTRPEFAKPKVWWTPVIAPSGFVIYSGDMFPGWQGDGFIGGLRSQALVRVNLEGTNASEAERFDMNRRIREVEQGPDGALYVLEDGGRLLRLTP